MKFGDDPLELVRNTPKRSQWRHFSILLTFNTCSIVTFSIPPGNVRKPLVNLIFSFAILNMYLTFSYPSLGFLNIILPKEKLGTNFLTTSLRLKKCYESLREAFIKPFIKDEESKTSLLEYCPKCAQKAVKTYLLLT